MRLALQSSTIVTGRVFISLLRGLALILAFSTLARHSAAEEKSPVAADSASSVPSAQGRAPYEFQPGVLCPFCQLTPQFPTGRSGLHWHDHWRTTGTREYVTILALTGAFIGVQLFVPTRTRASWDSPILFDGAVRDTLRIHSARGRRTAGTVSDVLFFWEVLHPAVIDPLLVAWWQREAPFVAWQMFVIDAQAYALTQLLTDITKRTTSRARPWVSSEDCASNPSGSSCGSTARYQSFFSGHSAVSATGAGLICAHHTQLNLYQSDLLDVGTCALAVAGTAVTGAMRIASDDHWASDVITGHLIGYLSGYLLPTLLYYRQFRLQPEDPHSPAPTFAALPFATRESLGATLLGQF
jgi:membrane-associated phospholipid phosphatase